MYHLMRVWSGDESFNAVFKDIDEAYKQASYEIVSRLKGSGATWTHIEVLRRYTIYKQWSNLFFYFQRIKKAFDFNVIIDHVEMLEDADDPATLNSFVELDAIAEAEEAL